MSITDTRHDDEHDEDEDSLFGSPPPSPGRPASPALALPSAGYSGSSMSTAPTQNVGTIALPGSQPDSELPINPIALSLNCGIVHRPPALPHQMHYPRPAVHAQLPVNSASLVREGAPAAQVHAARNAAASSSTLQKKSKKRTRPPSSEEPPPKPSGPEFPLPDPTAPLPTHFLRNQENLLGRAGRVGGIKPANIIHNRGATPLNPIVVDDDEEDRPTLGRRAQTHERTQPYIDPALLTAPTNQEIVSVLIGQKDIFPILEGVLKLVVGNTPATRPKTGSESTVTPKRQDPPTATTGPILKKRKLNRVPAGATDWDVPYPFNRGEGPQEYQETWERERGKQLITQLISLIKSAARKAATKKYLTEQRAKAKELGIPEASIVTQQRRGRRAPKNGSERATSEATQDSQSRETSCEVLQDTSNAPSTSRNPIPPSPLLTAQFSPPDYSQTHQQMQSQHQSTPPSEIDPSMASAFEQLMSTLDNMPDQGPSQQQPTPYPNSLEINPNFFAPSNAENALAGSVGTPSTPTPSSGVDQPLFDTWMSFLESFPMNFDGTTNAQIANAGSSATTTGVTALMDPSTSTTSAQTSMASSQCSTPGPLDGFDFASMIGTEMAEAGSGALSTSTSDFDAMLTSIFDQQEQEQHLQQQSHHSLSQPMDMFNPSLGVGGGDFTTTPTFGNHLIDPNLLALSIQKSHTSPTPMMEIVPTSNTNMHIDMNAGLGHQAISPIASRSSSLGGSSTSPGTPASAGWEMSMPDIYMGGGGSGGGGGGMESGMDGQGWHNGVGGGAVVAGNEDVLMDFGMLPEDAQGQGGGCTVDPKGKGKQKEVPSTVSTLSDVTSLVTSLFTPPPPPTPEPTTESTPAPQPSLPPAPQPQQQPASSQQQDDSRPRVKSAKEILGHTPLSRQLRRDDIIKRAEEQKRLIQKELDAVKTRLWETTIEQAALVTLQKRLGLT
ncbi:hypothetical protein BDN70DRAFT_878578 [Pholiota conissans]|uniref:Uncharacterized protein n=1 Tax=Pholiota conissans TaxID=109636 RepID=A0A9P5Z1E1_9AGAR|nr:hypothetical protein BDN70DRAFT_878578 [Pholiota conissans]